MFSARFLYKKNMQITKLADNGADVEIEVGDECLTFTRGEDGIPRNFWTTRGGNGYVKTEWAGLTIDEQNAVERFN